MGFFNRKNEIYVDEEELKRLRLEKERIANERNMVEEYVKLNSEISNEKQKIVDLKKGTVNGSNNSNNNASTVIKDVFGGIGNVLGEMAKNSKENEIKTEKKARKV